MGTDSLYHPSSKELSLCGTDLTSMRKKRTGRLAFKPAPYCLTVERPGLRQRVHVIPTKLPIVLYGVTQKNVTKMPSLTQFFFFLYGEKQSYSTILCTRILYSVLQPLIYRVSRKNVTNMLGCHEFPSKMSEWQFTRISRHVTQQVQSSRNKFSSTLIRVEISIETQR